MKGLEGILKLADNEFEAINQNGKFRSREEIDSVYKLVDISKDIYEIWCMEEEMEMGEEGMSSDGGSYYRAGRGGRGGSNRGGSYYEDGGSYYERRGRGRNASRDSRGRYNDGGSYREGSYYRDGGMMRRGGSYYEGSKEEFAQNLRSMMQEAPDEQTRQGIQQMLQQMGQG